MQRDFVPEATHSIAPVQFVVDQFYKWWHYQGAVSSVKPSTRDDGDTGYLILMYLNVNE